MVLPDRKEEEEDNEKRRRAKRENALHYIGVGTCTEFVTTKSPLSAFGYTTAHIASYEHR